MAFQLNGQVTCFFKCSLAYFSHMEEVIIGRENYNLRGLQWMNYLWE